MTIPEYLVGRRRAILEVVSDRAALGVAALLVLSAALARNYDRSSLLDQPWRLLGPFAASMAISGVLFLVVYGFARMKGMESPGIGRAYLAFLALYWMMAPMAWLYGIPYERFQEPMAAIDSNLWTLALVSIWRVALMTRVVSVIFGLRVRVALALVMLVADVMALVTLYLVPLPVVNLMGGIPEQQEVAWAALLASLLCWVTLPIWIVLTLIAAFSHRNNPEWRVPEPSNSNGGRRAVLACAMVASAAWGVLLPFTQPEQILAHRVDRAYREDGPAAALALMSAHDRDAFPPDWHLPPWRFDGDPPVSEFLDMLEALADHPHVDWVGASYTRRFRNRFAHEYAWPEELLGRQAVRLASILSRLREGPEMAWSLEAPYHHIKYRLERGPDAEPLPDDQRNALETLLRLAGTVERAEETTPQE